MYAQLARCLDGEDEFCNVIKIITNTILDIWTCLLPVWIKSTFQIEELAREGHLIELKY